MAYDQNSTDSSPSRSIPPSPPPPFTAPPPAPALPRMPVSLIQPSQRKRSHNKTKVLRVFRSVFRSFPIISPAACKMPALPNGLMEGHHHHHHHHRSSSSGHRVTGTLFGYRKGRVSFSMQESPRCLPTLVIELAMQTNVLQREMGSGMVRIALECEKRQEKDKTRIVDEPLWTMYCNGKKSGYGVKREATDEDLNVMEILKAVSMGAGVLPGNSEMEGPDGELAYMRAHFDRIIGSKDSETLYMLSPDGNTGPELSIFFVRI
ncbi:protein MIZU-KUSSEI 1 [Cannabis sativa]|uniref:Protein MIZU-KUSSEI 1 n=1 Tax=Cannabis sativa TaxID=3483 RepID=A0A803PBU7_CANSA|nr:protein MIZU-KUSSEI 1 [Cannabis sativa]